MALKDANKKHYFSTVNKNEVTEIFSEAAAESLSIGIWRKGQSENDLENFTALRFDPNDKLLHLKKSGSFLVQLVQSKSTGKSILIKCVIDKFQYFTSGVLNYDESNKEYSVKVENAVFVGQQRTNYRLMASATNPIQFKMDNKVFDALDVSTGGTSFRIPKEDSLNYQTNAEFVDCILRFSKQNFEIPVVIVAGQWEDDSGKTVKLGIKFGQLTPKLEHHLCKEINQKIKTEKILRELREKKVG